MNHTSPAPTSKLLLYILLGIPAVLLAVGIAWFIANRPGGPDGGGAKRITDPAAVRELIELRDLTLAALENEKFEDCERWLTQLQKLVPGDAFVVRNLAVSQQLKFGEEKGNLEEPLKRAWEATSALIQLQPESMVGHLLQARIIEKIGEDFEQQRAALQAAQQRDPKNPSLLFEYLELLNITDADDQPTERLRVAKQLATVAPDNLFLLQQTPFCFLRGRDPESAAEIQRYRPMLEPLARAIQVHHREDVLGLLDQAQEAARAGRWDDAEVACRRLSNVVRPTEASKSDALRLKRHSLEYIVLDFDTNTYDRNLLTTFVAATTLNPITWQEADAAQQPTAAVENGGPAGSGRDSALTVVDFGLTGVSDIVVAGPQGIRVVGRDMQSGSWKPLLVDSAAWTGPALGVLAADLDDDVDHFASTVGPGGESVHAADADLVVYGPDGVRLFENRREAGERKLVPGPETPELSALRQVQLVQLADLDHDGDLDLITVHRPADEKVNQVQFWSNLGSLRFESMSARVSWPAADFHPRAVAVVDWDRDVDLDVILIGEKGAGWMENLRHGQFRFIPWTDEAFLGLRGATCVRVVEWDGNGTWDLLGQVGDTLRLVTTRAAGDQQIKAQRTVEVKLPGMTDGRQPVLVGDCDNDGQIDLVSAVQQGDQCRVVAWGGSRTGGIGSMSSIGQWSGKSGAPTGGLQQRSVLRDFDLDGDLDLVAITDSGPRLWLNEGGNKFGWQDVRLRATQGDGNESAVSGRVNHYGIGSLLECKAGGRYQAMTTTDDLAHFGLGTLKQADVVRVLWTNGVPQNHLQPDNRKTITEVQTLKGSCPYLYTWDGEQYVFCTDLLWAAPIGLKFGAETVAPWREWEYLKVDGRRLQPRDQAYELIITEELWEAAYFDLVQLFAVDHPTDVAIYTNEKVGPASMAEPGLHTVTHPRTPIAATDAHARDWLDTIRDADERYTCTYEKKLQQGLAETHYLELDLGPIPDARRIKLYLTGWVFPTDTSLNVRLSQQDPPVTTQPPSLWTPAADGTWREVRPYLGFPGGKTKTIVVDISDVFVNQDHRLRIQTNMEFYWDQVWFTVDDPEIKLQPQPLTLLSATLRDRNGVSARKVNRQHHAPERPMYHQLLPVDWPTMDGKLTRFGDVQPLLLSRDDQHVVMGAGDELVLRFAAPPPPPAGMTRDFVIHNVGWDKDADLNTILGQTVEPLPFRAMTQYGEERPVDPEYRAYIRQYQTRNARRR